MPAGLWRPPRLALALVSVLMVEECAPEPELLLGAKETEGVCDIVVVGLVACSC